MLKNNAHIHLPPNFSAFETVEQAVDLAAAQGVRVLGVSNYYDYAVYDDFARLAGERGIFPLYGLEIICLIDELVKAGVKINDPGNPGKMYVCGKGITKFKPFNPVAQRIIDTIRRNDSTRMKAMVEATERVFAGAGLATGLDDQRVIDRVVRRHGSERSRVYLQERHVCQAFQEVLFEKIAPPQRAERLKPILGEIDYTNAVKVQNEIRSKLMKAGKPAYVAETFIGFADALRLIKELGGIPCYPVLADGASPICEFESDPAKLVEKIKGLGLIAAEFIPVRNAPDVLDRYVKTLRNAGLVVTAGTEHNTLDLLPIEPTCLKGAPIPEDLKAIFWEGACVVAAHQTLTAKGEPGFNGKDIEKFAKMGEEIIAAQAT
jgi:hypothetical protein